MQTLKEKISDLHTLILNGSVMEGFEKYYSDDVVMQENENAPTIGKQANRLREEVFFNNVMEFREAMVTDLAIGDDVTMSTWHFDYTHKEWGVRNYKQVSVQKWKDGKIIHEQFFYGN